MRFGLLDAPGWLWFSITGIPFGGIMALVLGLLGTGHPVGWPIAGIVGVASGVAFGAAMGRLLADQARRLRAAIGPMSRQEYAQARRAAARGPVPDDPVLRQQAALLAAHDHRELTRFRVPQSIVFASAFVGEVLAAVVVSPWFWLAAALFAGLLAVQVVWPRRLRRRIELLRRGGGGPPAP